MKVDARLVLCHSNFVRVVILFVSILGVVTLVARHSTKTSWLNDPLPNEVWKTPQEDDLKGKRRVWFKTAFWLEASLFLICPIPYYDVIWSFSYIDIVTKSNHVEVYYLASDFLFAAKFLRIYFVIRAIFNYNLYMDLYSKKLCKQEYGFTANIRFTFKSLLKTQPGLLVMSISIGSIVVLSYLLRIFELAYYNALGRLDFNNFFNAIWCVVISMTTVGYGDYYPGTDFGKWIIILTAFWGTFLISILILIASNIFDLTINEQKALNHLLQTRKAA